MDSSVLKFHVKVSLYLPPEVEIPAELASNTGCVCGELMEFGCSLARFVWQAFSTLRGTPNIEPLPGASYLIEDTYAEATQLLSGVKSAQTGLEVKTSGNVAVGGNKDKKLRNPSPLCAGECSKMDRRRPENKLLIEQRIKRVKPKLRMWRCQ